MFLIKNICRNSRTITKNIYPIHMNLSCKRMGVNPLIQPSEAIEMLKDPNVRFVDGSWHMDKGRDAKKEFIEERIPGAVHFCIDEISDRTNALPHMLPTSEHFSAALVDMKINPLTHVIVYGKPGCASVPRVWSMFHIFGHDKVSILDGGIEDWKNESGPISEGGEPFAPPLIASNENIEKKQVYNLIKHDDYVASSQDVLNSVMTGSCQIVDARSAARFNGEVDEPRAGLERGHIPGALNVPFTELVTAHNTCKFRDLNAMKDAIMNSGVILGSKIIFSCGSGVTAAVVQFALYLLGQRELNKLPLYDGSWSEWGDSKNKLPIVK